MNQGVPISLALLTHNLPRLVEGLVAQLSESQRAEVFELVDPVATDWVKIVAWDPDEVRFRIGSMVFSLPLEEINRPPDPSVVVQN